MKSWTFNLFDELERMRSEFDRLLGAGAFSDPIGRPAGWHADGS